MYISLPSTLVFQERVRGGIGVALDTSNASTVTDAFELLEPGKVRVRSSYTDQTVIMMVITGVIIQRVYTFLFCT